MVYIPIADALLVEMDVTILEKKSAGSVTF